MPVASVRPVRHSHRCLSPHPKEKSFMAFEIGYNQFESLEIEIKKYLGDVRYEIIKDMNGKNRMLFIYFNC